MTEELGQPIAYGRTAEIYAWHAGQVLKLFYDWFASENIEHEAQVARLIHASGLPVPAVGELIRVNGRYGLEYERIHGVSMWTKFQHQPWNVFRYARRCAKLQVAVHSIKDQTALPSQHGILETNIRHAQALSPDLRQKALSVLATLPDGDRLCHGDFWPGNILLTSQGEVIIDWLHASHGNPLADLARTTNLTLGFTRTSQSKRPFLSYAPSRTRLIRNALLQVFLRLCYPAYVDYYFRLCPGDRDEYRRWLSIVAAARLADNIPELEQMLITQVKINL